MSEISQQPGMDIESTFECPHCHKELPVANQLTHEVACARMHRDSQRAPMAQPIVRQSSSSAIPEVNTQQRAQPMPRREDRRVAEIAENRLVNCPNCEKSVREQDINSHMDNECLKNEMIPCEFCDEAIPMSNYNQHIESCQRRHEDRNQREQSPILERMVSESSEEQQQHEQPHEEQRQQQGPSAPDRGSSQGQGGVRGFLRNLAGAAGTAATHLLGLDPESIQRREREQEERRQHQLEQRRREEERQREFLEHMFGQPQVPRNLAPSNQNALIPYNGPNSGRAVIRTVERGPGGMIIVRSRVVPTNNQMLPQQPPINRPIEVNPLEMLLGMMGGGLGGGMIPIGNGEFEMGQPEERGLSKEAIDSLALIKYNKEANKNVSEDLKKCPICLDDFDEGQEVRFLWCTHRFHKGCVDQWLNTHTTCPLCKKDYSEAEQGFSP